MYQPFWGLVRAPFDQCLEPDFFYRSQTHQEALVRLRYMIENRMGAGLLAGSAGTGKSSLISMLAAELPEDLDPLIHVIYPRMSPQELLAWLAAELGDDSASQHSPAGSVPAILTVDRSIRAIQRRLTELTEEGRRAAIVMDDAHLIDNPQVLQTLQLLLNFQQRPEIDFSLILAGEPELLPQVQRMGQLNDRLAVRCVLRPLTDSETTEYVQHRLAAAGSRMPVFDQSAMESLFELTGGVPRKINRLCDLALLVGCADQLQTVRAEEIEAVARELNSVAAA
ncbi:MAG: AAA family ATPase [Planctomycetaceae bacterium]|nr:AAA family ATPase [Planctomycetaceae bacterium]